MNIEHDTRELIPAQLYRDRILKLEQTVAAYEASIHTNMIDQMRKRIDELESCMTELLAAMGVTCIGNADSVSLLEKRGIPGYRAKQIILLEGNKFAP